MRHLNMFIQSRPKYGLCLYINICFLFQLWLVYSTTNRIKNRPLTIIEPQAHKKLNLTLSCRNYYFCTTLELAYSVR